MSCRKLSWLLVFLLAGCAFSNFGFSQVLQPPFDTNYVAVDLGGVPGVPSNYGGMTFKRGDPSTLLIGGSANTASGRFYSISVVRGTNNHITGFTNTAQFFSAGENNDGGVAYGPGGVLFYSRYPNNEIGEIRPGSTNNDAILNLAPRGISGSLGGLNFVPNGFAGVGRLILGSYSAGRFYSATLVAMANGTYDITNVISGDNGFSGPEGFIFVPAGSPQFTNNQSMLINEYSAGRVVTCRTDTNGMPVLSTLRPFLTGLTGAEGAVIDPLTGDFLFSTYGGGNRIVAVQGFGVPPLADLAVSLNADTNSIPCRQLVYRISVTNQGPFFATSVFLTDILPTNAVLLGMNTDQGTVETVANTVSWSVGLLPLNTKAELELTLAFTRPGGMTNSIVVSANEGDPNPTNNSLTTISIINSIPATTLVMDRGQSNAVNLCWGSDNIGFNLESTTNLTQPILWQTISSNIVDNGSVKSLLLTNPAVLPTRFFRLRKP